MTRARSLSLLANANILTAEQTNNRVGIGSTIPDAKLDVDGDIVVGTAITIGKVSGIVSATDFYVDGISITGAAGTWATFTSGGEGGISTTKKVKIENSLEVTGVSTFSGNLTVGGVLSYADVTNVDSVGIVTARSGIEFGASGVGGTITAAGDATFAGIVTTTEFLHVFGTAGTSARGIEARSNSTQSTDTNKAIRVRNNSDTDTFNVSYRGAATFGGDLTIPDYIVHSGDLNTKFGFESGDTFSVETGGSERLRITSSGRVVVGNDTERNNYDNGSVTSNLLHVERTAASGNAGISICANAGTAADAGAILYMGRTKATSNGNTDVVAENDLIGRISFQGADGTQLVEAASIRVDVDGTPGANDMPGRIEFHTTADGSAGATERMRLSSDGKLRIGSASDEGLEFGTDANAILQLSTASAPKLILCRDDTSVTTGDYLGMIDFHSRDGGIKRVARIGARAGGNHGSDDGPTNLVFHTMGDNTATSAEERLRIDFDGNVHIGDSAANANGHALLSLTKSASAAFHALVIQQGNTGFTATDGLHIGIDASVDSYIKTFENRDIYFTTGTTNTEKLRINNDGSIVPGSDDSQDLGSTSLRWANIYSADLQLSNEGKGNDVDGTWGQYTIQEGENDLFLLNRRNGKKYRFMLEEV